MLTTQGRGQAVAVGEDIEYALVERDGDERLLVVAVDRLSALTTQLGHLTVLQNLSGKHMDTIDTY